MRLDARRAAACLLLLAAAGCHMAPLRPSTPSAATLPREWRERHPWGPAANEARARGELTPLACPPETAAWADWARAALRDGDVLFRRGRSCTLLGLCKSRFICSVCDSPFSHEAVFCFLDGAPFVYDATQSGVRLMPFGFWALDVAECTLAVKRVRPEHRHAIPAALAFCESAYRREVPYDTALSLDDEALYCCELIEKAFRAGGVALSDPVPIRCLPHYRRFSVFRPVVALASVRVDEPIFVTGNEHYGTFASPCLETVFDAGSGGPRRPPTCPTVALP